jgi:mannosyl-oligosaccharide alpha-1,2-mannosidase
MLRLRRYRAFLIFAAILVFAIVRLTYQKDWVPDASSAEIFVHPDRPPPKENEPAGSEPVKPAPAAPLKEKATEAATSRIAQKQPPISTSAESVHASQAVVPSTKSSPAATVQSVPHVVLPDRKIPPPTKVIYGDEDESQVDIHPVGPPSREDLPAFSAAPTTIHWEKQVEHFPVPTESIIHLPSGKPVKIPKIQHAFNDETTDAKITREKRQAKVRDQFKKAWTGYKQNAWLHDELSPVSGKFRDPFCGWAATLVDTLDTLWIMGLQEEFEEAARAVDLIDFTASPRGDIPVFETTIRYLGGLLAAYDVSGGQYKNLLDKAVELADILMGAFDTPNRMPVLFYRWKPAFASQPHRASQRSNLAELGSLSMEFTRLAQLTHEPRYYDAVARVTNALSEWQDRGTKLGGVFPRDVDASGCNRTVPLNIPESVSRGRGPALNAGKSSEEPLGYEPNTVKTVAEPKPRKEPTKEGPGTLEMDVTPGEPSKARIIGWDDENNKKEKRTPAKRDLDDLNADANSTASLPATTEPENDDTLANVTDFLPAKKGLNDDTTLHDSGATATAINPITGLPLDLNAARAKVGTSVGEWDCTPQGLQPSNQDGMNNFGMGGGQDSTYEYFPKVRTGLSEFFFLL